MEKLFCIHTSDFKHIPPSLFQLLSKFDIEYHANVTRTLYWLNLNNPHHKYVYFRYNNWATQID